MVFGIGLPELIIILLILIILFGAKKIPQLISSIGKSVKELKSSEKGQKK